MEVPGNRQLAGANPIFLQFLAATLPHPGARFRETREHAAYYVPPPASDFALKLPTYGCAT